MFPDAQTLVQDEKPAPESTPEGSRAKPGPKTTKKVMPTGKAKPGLRKRPAAAIEEDATAPVMKRPSRCDPPIETANHEEEEGPAEPAEPTETVSKKPATKTKKDKGELTFHNPSWHKNCHNWCLKSNKGHIMSVFWLHLAGSNLVQHAACATLGF